jgi:hypothetical protein
MQTVTLGATCLDETAGAAELRLSQDDLTEIDRIMSAAVPVGGPSPEGMT